MTRTRLRIFPAISRNRDLAKYVDELMRIARFSDRNGFAGFCCSRETTCLSSHGLWPQHILAHTANSSPLIAVNPIYMHPFTVAECFLVRAAFPSEDLSEYGHGYGNKRSARIGRPSTPMKTDI